MNLRPDDKEQNVSRTGFRPGHPRSQYERFQDLEMKNPNKYNLNEEMGFHAINFKIDKLRKKQEQQRTKIIGANQTILKKNAWLTGQDTESIETPDFINDQKIVYKMMHDTHYDPHKERLEQELKIKNVKLSSLYSPCAPMKHAKEKGQETIIPYKGMHKKLYFKTIE